MFLQGCDDTWFASSDISGKVLPATSDELGMMVRRGSRRDMTVFYW